MLTFSTNGGRFYHTLRCRLDGSRTIAACIWVRVPVLKTQPYLNFLPPYAQYTLHKQTVTTAFPDYVIFISLIASKLPVQTLMAQEAVQQERDLGIIITKDMKASQQCRQAYSKANKILGIINRTVDYKSREVLLKLYRSLVRPQLEFCTAAWSPH